MTRSRFLDLHVLHPVTAANLNRDESQEPKTLHLGGAIRSMVSPQAWKRPVRLDIEEERGEHAARTRMLPLVIAQRLRGEGWSDDLADFAAAQITRSAKPAGLKTNPSQGHRTQAMLYLPTDAADHLLALCRTHRPQLEQALADQTASGKPAPAMLPTADIAAQLTRRTATINLFGRMLAELPSGHVEGAVQMAPAFTVHPADLQPDFFTSVEDWPKSGDSGSAHLQTAFLTAGVFYRFATVNITELINNLGGDTTTALELTEQFTSSFIMTMPKGKKTSTAPHTIPDLVHYAVRDRRPISYGAAFEQPVKPQPQGGYTTPARTTLADYAATIDRLVGTRRRIAHGHADTTGTPTEHLGTYHHSYDDLAATCATAAVTGPTTGAGQ
ncbi:type I-E CRISPR-associated protein Cas7/Cse4/CasC [Streptomyces luteireticuli]|uniref:Type I-E CRISPR-associated protein Cas7/Cse4/CasC n=1 Tax=Streptomyces luteireticuli TaxID=173858 RepID=A0ABP3J302_9ACTN